jgi:hypothetical protein
MFTMDDLQLKPQGKGKKKASMHAAFTPWYQWSAKVKQVLAQRRNILISLLAFLLSVFVLTGKASYLGQLFILSGGYFIGFSLFGLHHFWSIRRSLRRTLKWVKEDRMRVKKKSNKWLFGFVDQFTLLAYGVFLVGVPFYAVEVMMTLHHFVAATLAVSGIMLWVKLPEFLGSRALSPRLQDQKKQQGVSSKRLLDDEPAHKGHGLHVAPQPGRASLASPSRASRRSLRSKKSA